MPEELNPTEAGVEEKQETAPQGEGGVSEPSPTAGPEGAIATGQPVDLSTINLDNLPQFRKYKSAEQKRIAEQQRRTLETEQRLASAQRELWEMRRRTEDVQLEAKLRDADPEEAKVIRAQHELERVREEASYYQRIAQEQQRVLQNQENLRGWAKHYKEKYNVPLEVLNISYGWAELQDSLINYLSRHDTPSQPREGTQQTQAQSRPAPPAAMPVAQHGTARPGPSSSLDEFENIPLSEKAKWTKEDWKRWGEKAR